jgi:hypothetical protein
MTEQVPDTVTEAIEMLRQEGYAGEFMLIGGQLWVEADGSGWVVDGAEVLRLFRFEGPTDPGDQMIVLGLRDPATKVCGTLAAAFGHSADPDLYRHLADLSHRFELG